MCTVKLLKKLAVFLTLSSFSISNSYLLGCVFSAAVMNDFLSYLAVSTECSDEIDGTVAHSGDHSGSSWNVPQPKIETASVSWEREDFLTESESLFCSQTSVTVFMWTTSACVCVFEVQLHVLVCSAILVLFIHYSIIGYYLLIFWISVYFYLNFSMF